jgi:hypothetical protein
MRARTGLSSMVRQHARKEKIGFAVNRRRAIAPFPPGSSIPRIDMADGAAAKPLHGARQALGAARRHQQVQMVGHQH